ncbi:MAG: c-type cytochrome, partial [Porticoccaceae bacterium]
ADRLTKGIETVYANAINGIGAMPAKGLCMDCSDDEIIATIDYMLENSQ